MSGSSDKSVRVWDIGKRECVQTLQELNHSDQVLLSDLCFPHHCLTSICRRFGVWHFQALSVCQLETTELHVYIRPSAGLRERIFAFI